MNEENGEEFAKELGSEGKFFLCNVLDTKSVAKAVQDSVQWAEQSGKPLGGVVAAAGVSIPATVRLFLALSDSNRPI